MAPDGPKLRLAPAARLLFSCFRARADNGWAVALAAVVPPQPPVDPAAPGPFAFGDPQRVEAILVAAGWTEIAIKPVDYAMIAGEGAHAIEDATAYFQRIGPVARAMAELAPPRRAAAGERLRDLLARHCVAGRVSLPAAAWIVSARSPPPGRL